MRLFRDPDFGTGAATITMVFLGTFALFYLVTQFVQQVIGYTPLATAIALAPLAVPLLTFSSLSSWYLPKVGLRAVVFASLVLVSVGFVCMGTLTPDSTYLDVLWPLLVISSGFGLYPHGTNHFRDHDCCTRCETGRRIGGQRRHSRDRRCTGIAMAGSILAGGYSRAIVPALTPFPQPVRRAASDSLAQALVVAERLGPQGHRLAEISKAAFVDAANSSYVVMAAIVGVAAILIPVFAPGRDGKQLRMLRQFSRRAE